MSDQKPDHDTRRDAASQGSEAPDHPAGPHAKPELTNPNATPGAGALPDPEFENDSAGGAG